MPEQEVVKEESIISVVQSQFEKHIGQEIWDIIEQRRVILTAITGRNSIMVQFEEQEPENGYMLDFGLIVENEEDAFVRGIPLRIAVVLSLKEVGTRLSKTTPEKFLEELKKIVYGKLNMTHNIMLASMKKRNRELVLSRQIIMSAWHCAFAEEGINKVSSSKAGKLYGKDHATVLHAIKAVNNLLDTDKNFREDYKEVWDMVVDVNPKSKLHII